MFQFFKNEKNSIRDIGRVFLVMILLSLAVGCASQDLREDSNHYMAQGNYQYGYSYGRRYGWPYYGYGPYQSHGYSFHKRNYERKESKYVESESWSWVDTYYHSSNMAVVTRQTKSYHYP